MDWMLRIQFYPSKFLDEKINVGFMIRVSKDTRSAILEFLKFISC